MEKSIEELIKDLNNDDEFVQEEAIGDLEIRANESTDPLIEVLMNKKSPKNVKINAANVLGAIGNEKAIEPLIATLKDHSKLVRREASTALTKIGAKSVDPLINILNDDDWKVRGAAAWALGVIGDKKAIEPLKPLLEDNSGYVKRGAKYSLAQLEK